MNKNVLVIDVYLWKLLTLIPFENIFGGKSIEIGYTASDFQKDSAIDALLRCLFSLAQKYV